MNASRDTSSSGYSSRYTFQISLGATRTRTPRRRQEVISSIRKVSGARKNEELSSTCSGIMNAPLCSKVERNSCTLEGCIFLAVG